MTFDLLQEPIGPQPSAMGREGSGARSEGKGEAKKKKKVIPCIGAAGGIVQMMLRWEGHVWRERKKKARFVFLNLH